MAFFSIRRTAQSVIAVAEPMRRGWPASEPSPKKLPSLNMPSVASLPSLETTVSLTLPVCRRRGQGYQEYLLSGATTDNAWLSKAMPDRQVRTDRSKLFSFREHEFYVLQKSGELIVDRQNVPPHAQWRVAFSAPSTPWKDTESAGLSG